MSDYRIFETKEFLNQLEKLSNTEKQFVKQKIHQYVYPQIKINSFYGLNIKKLKGYTPDTWRYRIGNYRMFYVVDKNNRILSILTIDSRKNIYRQ